MKTSLRTYRKRYFLIVLAILMGLSSHGQTYLESFLDVGQDFVTLGDNSYFMARSLSTGWGLWKTDGTQKGTVILKNMYRGDYKSNKLIAYKNELYFSAEDEGVGQELWKTDGTQSGTVLLKDINTNERWGISISNFNLYEGLLYFNVIFQNSGDNRNFIYRTDGTDEGTVLAEGFTDEGMGVIATAANGKLYFLGGGMLNETNGTLEGTKGTVIDGLEHVSGFRSFRSGLYFTTSNYNKTYIRLYKLTDIDTYTMIREFSTQSNQGLELYNLVEIGNKVVFSLGSGTSYDNIKDALWATDGTPQGTTELISFGNNNLYKSGNFKGFVEYNGSLYFNTGPVANSALWRTDGTLRGTEEVIPEARINDEAPMLMLNDKLYFLVGSSLFTYDSTLQESDPVFQLSSSRKSTGDEYFIKSDGRFVYSMVKNDREDDTYTMDFFHTGSNPLMKIVSRFEIKNNKTLSMDTKVDSLVIKEVNVQNKGNSPLIFSKVMVSGEGFYINGEVEHEYYKQDSQLHFPQQIAPSESGYFEVGFLPQSSGTYSGYLIIRSNDSSQPEFRIKLEGYASDITPESINGTFPMGKEIKWDKTESQIQLDNDFVSENAGLGTLVGNFATNATDENFTYQMVEGPGSDNNDVFTISDNKLLIGNKFQVDHKKSYTIRIRSVDLEGTKLEESFVIGVNEESVKTELGACEKVAIPLTTELLGVDFINDTDAIAVGVDGVILKTEDKGLSWKHLHTIERSSLMDDLYTLPARLFDVNFVNENTGFIIGEGALLRTDDAGLTWRPLQVNIFSSSVKLVALSPQNLFLVFDNKILKSIDGGKTWYRTTETGLGANLTLYFYNETTGFVSASWHRYSITEDGGITWKRYELELTGLTSDEGITDFSFVSRSTGYASTTRGKVLKTDDGGVTWVILNSDKRSKINEIHFIDSNRGYLVAGNIYETYDGGLSWEIVDLPNFAEIRSMTSNSIGDRIAVGGPGAYRKGRSISYAYSNDTWVSASELILNKKVRNIVFNDLRAYLFSESQSWKSVDGGVTWQEMITPIDGEVSIAERLGDVLLIKKRNLSEIYKSTDNGLSWTVLDGGNKFGEFKTLGENTIIAKNPEGGISKSIDAGNSWNTITNAPQKYAGNLDFLDESVGFMGGAGGIVSTIDGGITWKEHTVDLGSNSTYALKFASAQVGLVSCSKGYFKTIDGGDSWIRLSLYVAKAQEILAVSEMEWYVAAGITIYKSVDGGDSWEINFNGNYDILDIDLVDDIIYFSDNDGGVYRLVDDPPPLNAGYIKGDRSVRVGDQEIYTVAKQSDNTYNWVVTGDNELAYKDTFARIHWNNPGTYSVQVTPNSTCLTGNSTDIDVHVYGQMLPPEIKGAVEVLENSKGVTYATPQEEQVSYMWSVSGQKAFLAEGHTLLVDWSNMGLGEIGLIKTDLISGMRSYNKIDVNILPGNPFVILQTNTTCRNTDNGNLQITARTSGKSYRASLENTISLQNQEFSGGTQFDNLSAGNYSLCIEDLNTKKEYCYQFIISEPEPFEVSSKIGSTFSKEVSLNLKGGMSPYTVLLNGRSIAETSQTKFRFKAKDGDLLEVLSAGGCALSYTQMLYFPGSISVSPNPVSHSFVAELGQDFPQEVKEVSLTVFDSGGNLTLNTTVSIYDQSIQCDVSMLPSGIYLVQIGNSRQTSFKIIKK